MGSVPERGTQHGRWEEGPDVGSSVGGLAHSTGHWWLGKGFAGRTHGSLGRVCVASASERNSYVGVHGSCITGIPSVLGRRGGRGFPPKHSLKGISGCLQRLGTR